MKQGFKFIILIANFCISAYGESLSLIGSHYIPAESTYKALLSTHDISRNALVNVSFGETVKQLKNLNMNGIRELEFQLPHQKFTDYELKITYSKGQSCSKKSVNLINTSDRSLVFILFDKPIYKTGDEFKFKIFLLDQKMIPLTKHSQMDVIIFDSKNNAVRKFKNAKVSNFGIFDDSLKIADEPNMGKWKIQVNIDGREISKNFQVQQLIEDEFEVFIETASAVAFVDRKMFMGIFVKDENSNFFTGTAVISVKGRFKDSNRIELDHEIKTIDVNGNKKTLTIDFESDIGIKYPTADMILTFDVKITEKATKRLIKVSKDVLMRHKGRNDLQLIRKKYFKPGFKFPIKVRVKTVDGRIDNSFNQLKMSITYENRNNKKQLLSDEKSYNINLKNGETIKSLEPTPETEKIKVLLEFAGSKLLEIIEPLPTFGVNEYIQVSALNKSSTIGDHIKYTVQTSADELDALHLLVFGSHGLIYHREFLESQGKDIFNFTIELTEEMMPESRGLVFYVKNGVIIFDEFSLNIGFSIDNSLEISAKENVNLNENVNLDVKSTRGSLVFLAGIDHTSSYISRENEISRSDIYNELVFYMSKKFPNLSSYEFEKLNAFILEPLDEGDSCNHESKFDSKKIDPVDTKETSNFANKYFPDIWFEHQYQAASDEVLTISAEKLPNGLRSWRIFGFSLHPTKGFTVAKSQPVINAKVDLSTNINTPAKVYEKEKFKMDMSIFNSLNDDLTASVNIEIVNGILVRETSKVEFNIKCKSYAPTNRDYTTFARVSLPAEKMSTTESFLIQSIGRGDIKIIVAVTAGRYKNEAIKIVKVENMEEKVKKAIFSSQLIELRSERDYEEIDNLNELQNTSSYVTIYGNLLGPALNGFDTLFDKPLVTDEERMSKFAAALINYNYLSSIGLSDHQKGIKALNDVLDGYQESIAIINRILVDSTYQSTWLAAYIADILIDAQKIIEIDQRLIFNLLNFIMKTLKSNIPYDYAGDFHRDIALNFRPKLHRAFLIAPFLKDPQIKKQYHNELTNSLNNFYSISREFSGDYAKAVVACILALDGQKAYARGWIQGLKRSFEKPTHEKHMSTYVEIVSYIILTKQLIQDDPQAEIRWLLKNRKSNGEFFSPYDTVLALKALSNYAQANEIETRNLQLTIDRQKKGKGLINKLESETVELSPQNRKLMISGHGLGYVSVYSEQPNINIDTRINFIINSQINDFKNGNIDIITKVTLSAVDFQTSNLAVVEVELPRGFKYIGHDSKVELEKVKFDIKRNFVIFHINKMTEKQTYSLTVKAAKIFDIENHEFSIIRAYDVYRPNLMDTHRYHYDINKMQCEQIDMIKVGIRKEEEKRRRIKEELNKIKEENEMVEELIRIEQQKRLEEERRRIAEQQRIEEEERRRIAEQRRIEEEARRKAEEERQRQLAEQREREMAEKRERESEWKNSQGRTHSGGQQRGDESEQQKCSKFYRFCEFGL